MNWLKIARFGAAMAGAISPAIPAVEALAERVAGAKGPEKKAAVMALVAQAAQVVDDVTAKQILDSREVREIAGQIIDLQVALHHAIAKAVEGAAHE